MCLSTARTEEENANPRLAGNISNSWFIKDKDNWLMENVLKECCDYMFFKESWTNFFNVRVSKAVDPPVYVLDEYSHKEIANMLSISVGTSKSNLPRARGILRDKIESNQSQIKKNEAL